MSARTIPARPIEPGQLIDFQGHVWRVNGVHLGGIGTESLVEMEPVSHQPGWTGEWMTHQMMFVPVVLIDAALHLNAGADQGSAGQ